MQLTSCKTKIVAALGPASESFEVMWQMLEAGMKVARINFSHGDAVSQSLVESREDIDAMREAGKSTSRTVLPLVPA